MHFTHLHTYPHSESHPPHPCLQVRVDFAQNWCCGYSSPCQGHEFPSELQKTEGDYFAIYFLSPQSFSPLFFTCILEAATKVEIPGFLLSCFFTALLHGKDSPSPSSAPAGLSRPLWAAWDPIAVHIVIPLTKCAPPARHPALERLWAGDLLCPSGYLNVSLHFLWWAG